MDIHIEVIRYLITKALEVPSDMRLAHRPELNQSENSATYPSMYFILSTDIQNGERQFQNESHKHIETIKLELRVMTYSGFYAMRISIVSPHCLMNLDIPVA